MFSRTTSRFSHAGALDLRFWRPKIDIERSRMRHRGALHERRGPDQDHAGVREPRVRVDGDDLVGVGTP